MIWNRAETDDFGFFRHLKYKIMKIENIITNPKNIPNPMTTQIVVVVVVVDGVGVGIGGFGAGVGVVSFMKDHSQL